MKLKELLAGKLILVTGKGGTGKSALSAALGTISAESGRDTIIVEVDANRPAMNGIFGVESKFSPKMISANLSVSNLDWVSSLSAWIVRTVPAGRLVKHLLGNKLIRAFLDVAPGNRETVVLSQIAHLVESYDLVIVDMPASGHTISLLDFPRTMLKLFSSGPIRREGERSAELLAAEGTNLVFVSLSEEMVVNETIETFSRAHEVAKDLEEPLIFLNRSTSMLFSDEESKVISKLSIGNDHNPLVTAGEWRLDLEAATRSAKVRLETETEARVVVLPEISHVDGSAGVVSRLAEELQGVDAANVGTQSQ
jgi:anion-transporting  ArsA/GET3 family ATPase